MDAASDLVIPQATLPRAMPVRTAMVVVFFLAVAPTLRWFEFFHAGETVIVARARGVRRTGRWLIPPLQGPPRPIKPPLTVWITAAAIRPRTLANLSDPDPATR